MKSLRESLFDIDNNIDNLDFVTYIELFKKCKDIELAYEIKDMIDTKEYMNYDFSPLFIYLDQYNNWMGRITIDDEDGDIREWVWGYVERQGLKEKIKFLNKECKLKGSKRLNPNNIENIYVNLDEDDECNVVFVYYVVYKNMHPLVKDFMKYLSEEYNY